MSLDFNLLTTTSHELAVAIRKEMNNEEHPEQPPTLGSMLDSMQKGLYAELVQSSSIDPDLETSIIEELESLVEHFGDEAPAEDFVAYSATENLTLVIHAMLNNLEPEQPPTLTTLRNSIALGICTQLVATGEIDMDDEHTLIAEVDDLIKLHGEDTPAELFLR